MLDERDLRSEAQRGSGGTQIHLTGPGEGSVGWALRGAPGAPDTVRRVEEGMLPWGFSPRRRQGRAGHARAEVQGRQGCAWLGLAGGRGAGYGEEGVRGRAEEGLEPSWPPGSCPGALREGAALSDHVRRASSRQLARR